MMMMIRRRTRSGFRRRRTSTKTIVFVAAVVAAAGVVAVGTTATHLRDYPEPATKSCTPEGSLLPARLSVFRSRLRATTGNYGKLCREVNPAYYNLYGAASSGNA